MTSQAKIVISAVDNASATMLRIRAEMRAMTQPMRDIKSSFGRFAEASGMKQIGRDMGKVAQSARSVAGAVSSIVAPMAAVVGVGSIAGIAEMSRKWADLGWSVERTAQTIGVAPGQLQALRGAAKLAGLSADDMTSSLSTLGSTLEDALYGRNPLARNALAALHVSIHRTASGAVDTTRALTDLSAVIQKYGNNPQVQRRIAAQFGLESLLPLLRQGPKAIAALEAKARSLGYVLGGPALKKSEALGKSFAEMMMSMDGLRNSIAVALSPVVQSAVGNIEQWVSANRQLIGQRVSEWVGAIVGWLRSVDWKGVWADVKGVAHAIAEIGSGIQAAVTGVGGWKNAMELMFGAWALGKVTMFAAAVARVAKGLGAVQSAGGFGLLGKAGLVGAAGMGGYELGKHFIAPGIDRVVSNTTGRPNSLGGAIFDWMHPGANKRMESRALFPYLEKSRGLPRGLLDAVWAQESGRGRHLRSAAGALGDFQFMPSTAELYGLKNPMNFRASSVAAASMYGDLLRQYRGNLPKALAAYNWGSGNVNEDIATHGSQWLRYAPRETQSYVRDVQARMAGAADGDRFSSGRIQSQRVELHITMGNMPPGSRVQAKDARGNDVPVRVSHSLVGAH